MTIECDKIFIESIEDLRKWLSTNYASKRSVWIVTWKKGSGHPYISYDEVVDQCLCFGWIDSLPKKLDSERTMLRISPRNPKSNWSKLNKERVDKLIKAGWMEPNGIAMVELAKRTGTWNFLDDVENLELPEDLEAEFENHPNSKQMFQRFPPSSQRGILEWIKTAKKDSTRKKRIIETAIKASQNIKANHPKGRDAGPTAKSKD